MFAHSFFQLGEQISKYHADARRDAIVSAATSSKATSHINVDTVIEAKNNYHTTDILLLSRFFFATVVTSALAFLYQKESYFSKQRYSFGIKLSAAF